MLGLRKVVVLAAAGMLMSAVTAQAAVVVQSNAPGSWTSALAAPGATLGTAGGTFAPAPSVVNGSIAGEYKSPFDPVAACGGVDCAPADVIPGWEDIQYYTVGSPGLAASPVVLTFTSLQSGLNLLWGSVDLYNALVFSNSSGGPDVVISGADVFAAGGAPAASGAAWVSIFGFLFDSVAFRSDYDGAGFTGTDVAAFEFASVSQIPLPAAAWLIIAGIGGLGLVSRRRKSADA